MAAGSSAGWRAGRVGEGGLVGSTSDARAGRVGDGGLVGSTSDARAGRVGDGGLGGRGGEGLEEAAGVAEGGVPLGLWGLSGCGVSRVGGRMRTGGGAGGGSGSGGRVGTGSWGGRELGVSCTSLLALVGGDGGVLVGEDVRFAPAGTLTTAGVVGVAVATTGAHLCLLDPPSSTLEHLSHARALWVESHARGGARPRW